jgi:hypothetical protein
MMNHQLNFVEEISGADVFGGEEMISPFGAGVILALAGYMVQKWPEMKQGFADGYYNR